MIAIVDYGAGNVQSVAHALAMLGQASELTSDRDRILKAEGVILPGVGAFGEAMRQLRQRALLDTLHRVRDGGKPFLGVCIGQQLLFESSEESPGVQGLRFLKGSVRRISPQPDFKVPHMGWNQPQLVKPDPLFEGIGDAPWFYFVHSFYVRAEDPSIVVMRQKYGMEEMDVAVRDGNLWAVQFHPEKSGKTGLKVLENFCAICRDAARKEAR